MRMLAEKHLHRTLLMGQKKAAVKAKALAGADFPAVSASVMWSVFLNSIEVAGTLLNNTHMSLL